MTHPLLSDDSAMCRIRISMQDHIESIDLYKLINIAPSDSYSQHDHNRWCDKWVQFYEKLGECIQNSKDRASRRPQDSPDLSNG